MISLILTTALSVCMIPFVLTLDAIRPGLHTLAPRAYVRRAPTQGECYPTTLLVNKDKYEARCGYLSDQAFPCFTHWAGDLKYVQVRPWTDPIDMTRSMLVKDDAMLDFTVKDPRDSFIITYLDGGHAQLLYSDYDLFSGCYNITLRRGEGSKWRIWVSDEKSKDRDIDTKYHTETSKRFCTKWCHIHVKREG